MTDALLKAVVDRAARCAIIDITGIDIMDTGTADHFVRMAKSVKLLGADCVLTGINPHIARTLVQMDVQLVGITTYRSLRTALQRYISKIDLAKLEA
jgi:rsbT co-antagonist protein RsbR